MATGPEHYRAAEEAQEAATIRRRRWDETGDANDLAASAWDLANAAVHAQLATAAAFASQANSWHDRESRSAALGYSTDMQDC